MTDIERVLIDMEKSKIDSKIDSKDEEQNKTIPTSSASSTSTASTVSESINLPDIEEMLKSGLHFGHSHTKVNPKMKDYILGYQQGISILDLTKTRDCLAKALTDIERVVKNNQKILFVGTSPIIKDLVKEIAIKTNMFYVTERWIGGTLTNFKVISKRIKHLLDLEEEKRTGDLKKYTKKERVVIDKKIEKMEQKFGGIKNIKGLPGLIIVIDPKENILALQEAKKIGIPTAAICDTNANPDLVDFSIPANNRTISSVKMILNLIEKTISNNVTI